jgi:excinuclease UvrABC helicase subunit UvrB
MRFELASNFEPCGDQPKAIDALIHGLDEKKKRKSF